MRALDLVQGSPEWHAHRANSRNASDAPAVMGASKNVSRNEMLRLKATGSEREFSEFIKKKILERGHEVEEGGIVIAEQITGQTLYRNVGVSDDGYLSASFDGLTMDESIVWECKQWNEEKAASVRVTGQVPPEDYWQCVQQLEVSRAEKLLYMVTDGTEKKEVHCWLTLADVLADTVTLRAGWAQFDEDVASYVPEPVKPAPVAAIVTDLPAVSVQVSGALALISNFEAFEAALQDFIEFRLIRSPQTDDDFATLDLQIKALKKAEAALDAAEASALAQVSSVEQMQRQKAALHKLARDNRLMAEKLLTAEKDARKAEIAASAKQAIGDHVERLNETLREGGIELIMPANAAADIAAAMKGLRTITTLKDAADGVVAKAKIALNAEADRIRMNVGILNGAGRKELFADRFTLATTKTPEDLRNLVAARIAAADKAEADRIEADRARIRAEEEKRARDAAEKLAEQERERIRKEEQARAQQAAAQNAPQPSAAETPAAVAVLEPAQQPPVAAVRPGGGDARINLGGINARLAPVSISGDGLAALGFTPVDTTKTAKLYRESDFPAMCIAIGRHLRKVLDAHTMKEAA